MKIEKPLPGMILEETERQLIYMSSVVMFKEMYNRGIVNQKELYFCKETMRKKYNPPIDPFRDEL